MRKAVLFPIFALLACASCKKTGGDTPTPGEYTEFKISKTAYEASFASSEESVPFRWITSDQIGIFVDNTEYENSLYTPSENGDVVVLKAKDNPVKLDEEESTKLFAYFPYSDQVTSKASIPAGPKSVQTIKGGLNDNAYFMFFSKEVSGTQSVELKMTSRFAVLELGLTGTSKISKIEIEPVYPDKFTGPLCQEGTYNLAKNEFKPKAGTESNKLTVLFESPLQLNDNITRIQLSVMPCKIPVGGFRALIYGENGKTQRKWLLMPEFEKEFVANAYHYAVLSDIHTYEDPSTYDTRKEADNKIVAHRGGARESGNPDNSIAGIKYSCSLGCFAIECDALWTKDERAMIHHGGDVDAKVNGLVPFENTYPAIASKGKLKNGEVIPVLEQMIDTLLLMNDYTKLWIELKSITGPNGETDDRNGYSINVAKVASEIIKNKGVQHRVEFFAGRRAVVAGSVQYTKVGTVKQWETGWGNNQYTAAGFKAAAGGSTQWLNTDIASAPATDSDPKNYGYFYPSKYISVAQADQNIADYLAQGIKLSVYSVNSSDHFSFFKAREAKFYAITSDYPKAAIKAFVGR